MTERKTPNIPPQQMSRAELLQYTSELADSLAKASVAVTRPVGDESRKDLEALAISFEAKMAETRAARVPAPPPPGVRARRRPARR